MLKTAAGIAGCLMLAAAAEALKKAAGTALNLIFAYVAEHVLGLPRSF